MSVVGRQNVVDRHREVHSAPAGSVNLRKVIPRDRDPMGRMSALRFITASASIKTIKKIIYPQMTPMSTDLNKLIICANLRNLWINNVLPSNNQRNVRGEYATAPDHPWIKKL